MLSGSDALKLAYEGLRGLAGSLPLQVHSEPLQTHYFLSILQFFQFLPGPLLRMFHVLVQSFPSFFHGNSLRNLLEFSQIPSPFLSSPRTM